jgi:DNA recombination-dependent growth factor C
MAKSLIPLRCATFKFSERTRAKIEEIRRDREKQDNALFGFFKPISATDVLRYLIDQEIYAMEQRAIAAHVAEQEKQRKESKLIAQRQRRALKKDKVK